MTYWNIPRSNTAKWPVVKRQENAWSSQNSSLKIETGIFLRPGTMIKFSSLVIFGISEKKCCPIWWNSVNVQGIFNWSAFYFTFSVIYIFTHFFSFRNNFFNNTSIFSLNFNNIGKPEHVLIWESLYNRNIFLDFIMSFQTNSRLV